ncbi:hypothetical protein WBN84_14005 [Pseudoxanthomonas sp. CCNWLY206]
MGVSDIHNADPDVGSSSTSVSARFLGEDEFRQPLVAASPAKPVETPDPKPQAVADRVVAPVSDSTAVITAEATDSLASSSPAPFAAESGTQNAGSSEPSIVGDRVEERGHDSDDDSYVAALRAVIRSKWIRQGKQAAACSVTIQQTVGGSVISATSKSCALSEVDRRALEAATLAAQPLPYAGYEEAFRENLTVEMEE